MRIANLSVRIASALAILVAMTGTNANATVIFTDNFFSSTANDNNINAEIGARTSGTATVSSYNEGVGGDWQTQLRTERGGSLLLAPHSANDANRAKRIWAGPDLDFNAYFGSAPTNYSFTFDVDPNDTAQTWAGFTFGVTAANQGSWVNANHGGLSVLLRENGQWAIFDGTDGSNAKVATGTEAAAGTRNVLLDVFDSGTDVTLDFSINGNLVDSYTYSGSFDGNYVAFSAHANTNLVDDTYGVYFDNFTVTAVPEPSTYALMGLCLLGIVFVRRESRWRA